MAEVSCKQVEFSLGMSGKKSPTAPTKRRGRGRGNGGGTPSPVGPTPGRFDISTPSIQNDTSQQNQLYVQNLSNQTTQALAALTDLAGRMAVIEKSVPELKRFRQNWTWIVH